jgi:ABC-type Zn uptake system ZnuABC Zn-binding protein ZnuA
MKTQLLKRALLLLLTLCVCGTLSAQEAQPFKNLVSIKLIDASTKRVIANAASHVCCMRARVMPGVRHASHQKRVDLDSEPMKSNG